MSPQAHRDRTPTRKESTYIKSHASTLKDLPPPPEEWTADRLPHYLADNLRKYTKLNIVERVDNPSIDRGTQQVYRTTRMGWNTIQDYDNPSTNALPCGHTGWTNTGGDSKPFECLTCGDRYREDQLPL